MRKNAFRILRKFMALKLKNFLRLTFFMKSEDFLGNVWWIRIFFVILQYLNKDTDAGNKEE